MDMESGNNIGKILRQRRLMIPLTLVELAATSGISSSYLGRIENGQRFPSAYILRKIAKPLGFEEIELFSRAGFLSPAVESQGEHNLGQLDPYVAGILSQEPVEVQRAVIGILSILKSIAGGIAESKVRTTTCAEIADTVGKAEGEIHS